jgi:iron complex transport system substrate-binding protein
LIDDLGRAIPVPPGGFRRVVSLAPVATENLFAAGAGARVVGVTGACTYPAAVAALPRVGDFTAPSYERLHALRPDLVVVESATILRPDTERLAERLRLPVFVQKSLRIDDIPRHLEQLGGLTGTASTGQKAARAMRQEMERISRRVRDQKPVSVFIEVGETPLYAVGPGSFLDDLIRRAGGVNIVRAGGPFPVVSREALLLADPAHYVIAGNPGGMQRAFAPPLDRLSAVRRGQVHTIPPDLLFRSTPRLVDGLRQLAEILHPARRG